MFATYSITFDKAVIGVYAAGERCTKEFGSITSYIDKDFELLQMGLQNFVHGFYSKGSINSFPAACSV